jgi:hypothetical protein
VLDIVSRILASTAFFTRASMVSLTVIPLMRY